MPDAVHPRGFDDVAGHAPARVTLPSGSYSVDRGGDDPTIRDVTDADVRALADAYDVAAARVRVGDDTPAPLGDDPADMIDRGVCPWCSDYEGDHVGQHASSAHPDEWDAYTE